MEEFSQSRYRLESRYHHVLVDEFQDTSRAQWELVSLLVESWGEGLGLATSPSVFIVGDRKQSIYRFRDADVAVLREAGRPSRRCGRRAARAVRSPKLPAVPELLAFVNDVFTEMSQDAPAATTSRSRQRSFPGRSGARHVRGPVLGIAVADDP